MVVLQIDIAAKLVSAKIEQQDIIILSPYNAQVSEIKDALKKKKMAKINVTTISKSQGDNYFPVITTPFLNLKVSVSP